MQPGTSTTWTGRTLIAANDVPTPASGTTKFTDLADGLPKMKDSSGNVVLDVVTNTSGEIYTPLADGSVTAEKVEEYIPSDEHANGNIYVPERTLDLTNQYSRWTFLRKLNKPQRGISIEFKKKSDDLDYWPIYEINEGRMVPAWYAAFTPDAVNGSPVGTNVANNIQYLQLQTDDHWAEWTVPAGAPTCDYASVFVVRVVDGGDFQVLVNGEVAGSGTTNGATNWHEEQVIPLTIPAGPADVVRIRRTAGTGSTARIESLMLYDSTGIVTGDEPRYLIESTKTAVTKDASSIEFAYSMKPDGDAGAYKYFGGWAHEGNDTYWEHVSTTETFLAGGGAYTLARGYKAGKIAWTISSTARYDSDPTDAATVYERFDITGDAIWYSHQLTATVAIDVSVMYPAMFPAVTGATSTNIDGLYTMDLTSMVDGDTYRLPTCANYLRIALPADTRATFDFNKSTRDIENIYILHAGVSYRKHYLTAYPDDMAIGDIVRGGWGMWFHGT